MLQQMQFLIGKAWEVLNLTVRIDTYSFQIWQPFAFAILINLFINLLMNVNLKPSKTQNSDNILENKKYTPWN
jgi:hypothetical protein